MPSSFSNLNETVADEDFIFFQLILFQVFHGSEEHHLGKVAQLTEPVVDHLGDRGGGHALNLADGNGRHHQKGGQVKTQIRLKEEWLEDGGGVGDDYEKEGWKVCCHHLAHHDFPLHGEFHPDSSIPVFSSADLVMVKRVMSLGCTMMKLFESRVIVFWSGLSSSMSMEHS